jgi:hypothetical protein
MVALQEEFDANPAVAGVELPRLNPQASGLTTLLCSFGAARCERPVISVDVRSRA